MKTLHKDRVCFRSHFVVKAIPPDEVFLLSEEENKILRGHLYFLIAKAMENGATTVDEIVDSLEDQASLAEIYYAIEKLRGLGFFEEATSEKDEGIAALCRYLEVPLSTAKKKITEFQYQICNLTDHSSEPLDHALSSYGFEQGKNLTIIVVDDYLDERILEVIAKLKKAMQAYVLFKPAGKKIWMGPFITADSHTCFPCLSYWMKWNHLEETYIKKKKGDQTIVFGPKAILETTVHLAMNAFALELFKRTVNPSSSFINDGILTFDLVKNKFEKHTTLKSPHCCGNQVRKPIPIELQSRKKTAHADGGNHSVSPEETVKKYSHLLSPITGIIPDLQKLKIGENLYVFSSSHHNFAIFDRMGKLGIENFRQVAAGKGKTAAQAKASALCEGLERHSGMLQGDEIILRASFEELGKQAIDPRTCLLFSDFQYQNREKNNKTCHRFHVLPSRFDEEAKIDWTPLWSLTENRFKYLPTSYCYYLNGSVKIMGADEPAIGNSNGCAAGNTIEEAILQGFFELVERDCVAIWWYNRIQRPEIDLETIDDPYIQTIQREYRDLGRELWVLNLTSDLQIPTFVALSRLPEEEKEAICFGFGSCFDPKIALFRALNEMTQSLVLDEKTKKNLEVQSEKFDAWLEWSNTATLAKQPYLIPKGVKKISDFPVMGTDDLKEDILLCQKIVEEKGMEMLVLDQTRPEVGLPVVRVVVPGLRHFWPNFAPGRLYDVPVEMGWLKKKKTEAELNPIGMMI